MGRYLHTALRALPGIGISTVIAAAGVKPADAISNLGGWWELVTGAQPPHWLADPKVDNTAIVIGLIALFMYVVLLFLTRPKAITIAMSGQSNLPPGPVAIWIRNAEGAQITNATFHGPQTAIVDDGKNTRMDAIQVFSQTTPQEAIFAEVANRTLKHLPVKIRWMEKSSQRMSENLASYLLREGFNVIECEAAAPGTSPIFYTFQMRDGTLYVDVSK